MGREAVPRGCFLLAGKPAFHFVWDLRKAPDPAALEYQPVQAFLDRPVKAVLEGRG